MIEVAPDKKWVMLDGATVVVVVDVGTVVVVGAAVVVVPGFTVTVKVAVEVWPAPFETVSVYVVVTVGLTRTVVPVAMFPTPLSIVALDPMYSA